MPIDARIPLLGQAPHIEQFDLAKPLLAAAQLQEIKAQGQYRHFLADKVQRDEHRRVAFGEVLSRYDLDNPQESRQALRELSRIDPQASLEVRSNLLAGQKEQRLAQSAELEYLEKQNRLVGQVAQSILDAEDRGEDPQPLYEEGVAYLGSKDIPVQGLSPTYDRRLVTMFRDRSLTAADRLKQATEQRQQAEFEEQKRANQAREKQQERQDETTRRGQDLRAAASADKRTAAETARATQGPRYGYGRDLDAILSAQGVPEGQKPTREQVEAAWTFRNEQRRRQKAGMPVEEDEVALRLNMARLAFLAQGPADDPMTQQAQAALEELRKLKAQGTEGGRRKRRGRDTHPDARTHAHPASPPETPLTDPTFPGSQLEGQGQFPAPAQTEQPPEGLPRVKSFRRIN